MDEKSTSSSQSKEKSMDLNKSIDERVHQQLVYKDNRIIDLNNVILDKERQILDLQERVREHNEVATVKNQAMRIVQQKFEEMNRDKKDMSTETDPGLLYSTSSSTSSSSKYSENRRARSSSPGHVIAARKSTVPTTSSSTGSGPGTFSPPPLDPPFDPHSKLAALPDIDGIHRKNQRKRVTFDLNPGSPRVHLASGHGQIQSGQNESMEHVITEITTENSLLRQQVAELVASIEKLKIESEAEVLKWSKEAKTAGLKAKVVATARIKELESTLEEINGRFADENGRLQEEVETLRSSRLWEIEQNSHLRDKVDHLKEKVFKLTEELDASEKAKRLLDSDMTESNKLMELMVEDLLQAENAINYHVNQKTAIFEDIDRLKDAINAQDRFIEILEADIVIYEQHIGLLRENLGASQIDHRALIKSKAFETKLLALEREKEQSDKKSNEDRLKTKALDKKCRVLVEQNEQLMAKLCELEMSHGGGSSSDDAAKSRKLADQDERIRQISSALESERDVSQRLREAKEALEKELMIKKKQEEAGVHRYQRDVEMSRMEAHNKVEEMSVEVEAARKKVADVMAEVEQLRATNFDLQMTIETAKRTMEELADSNEDLEKQIEKIEEECEEKDEDLKQSTWDVETLTRQNEALSPDSRVELDGIRQGFHETRELSEEVKVLKSELQRQQEHHRAQFEAACERLEEEEGAERKTNLEVQQEQYILEYEKQMDQMRMEMATLKKELEMKSGPQRKTTAALDPPRIEEIVQMTVSSQLVTVAPQEVTVPAPDPELQKTHEKMKEEIEELKRKNMDFAEKMQRLEMEAKLSGELNVELGRAMLELEEHNELLRKEQEATSADDVATGRELELHVLMVQEMTEQIASQQGKIDEMEAERRQKSEEFEKLREQATSAHQETQRVNSELERLIRNLAESEMARKDEAEAAAAALDTEIREFALKMEDARRDIADLEARLEQAQATVIQPPTVTQVTVEQPLQSTTDDQEVREDQEPENLLQSVSDDMSKLIELKDELEIAVQALKAEIWSLNGQLKASILDREQLEDKITELDDLVEKEKKRAIGLDSDLQEQVDLTERAVRRAAEAENESNQRMAECLEKETRREEIEQAYTRLNEYYNQLQEAYNTVYAQLSQLSANPEAMPTSSEAPPPTMTSSDPNETRILDGIMTILLISRDPMVSSSTCEKLEKIASKLKHLLEEYDENQKALEEQKRITVALEERLQMMETSGSGRMVDPGRLEQLEGEIEWKEEECEGLKRRIRDLEKALEAVAERADETEAARLTTRQADVDSLFRTNAELAHTNVRLQNEVDEMEEAKTAMIQEKEALEQHVKELEEQVAELMEQHEAHLQQSALLQSTTPILSSPPIDPRIEESESEIRRLTSIEKTLNNRILALEDQNLELEEKVQEIEDQMMTVKQEKGEIKEEGNDEELEEAKTEIGRLLEMEKALKMRVEVLIMENEQLGKRVKEVELEKTTTTPQSAPITTVPPTVTNDDDWGWGDEDNETTATPPDDVKIDNSELEEAKTEVIRLTQIEKVLNKRISGLEEQNLELEERLQELEDELSEEKAKKVEIPKNSTENVEIPAKTEDAWDDWGEEEEKEETTVIPEDTVVPTVTQDTVVVDELQKTIDELQERVRFQKEVIEKAESELIETQDKYDELEEAYQQALEAQNPNLELQNQLDSMKSQLKSLQTEKLGLETKLEEIEAEKMELEERIKELETTVATATVTQSTVTQKKEEDDGGWNDDGWGDDDEEEVKVDEKKNEEKEEEIVSLTARISELESENYRIQQEFTQKLAEIDSEKLQITQKLQKTQNELEKVRKELKEKEAELNSTLDSNEEEIEKMRETQTILELKVNALGEEMMRVKEREAELSDENSALKSHLQSTVSELESVRKELIEARESSAWNDDDAWKEEPSDDVIDALKSEISERNLKISELSEKLKEMEGMRSEMKKLEDQNELLKDSEARLLDHSDEFAIQMERFKEESEKWKARVQEMEETQRKRQEEGERSTVDKKELVEMRQFLSNAQLEIRTQNATISDREGQISELRREISQHLKTIEELNQKLKMMVSKRQQPTVAQQHRRISTSSSTVPHHSSRPSSRLSTVSTASSFVPEAHANPIQSHGSAFDVVLPQSGEPLRRRNK